MCHLSATCHDQKSRCFHNAASIPHARDGVRSKRNETAPIILLTLRTKEEELLVLQNAPTIRQLALKKLQRNDCTLSSPDTSLPLLLVCCITAVPYARTRFPTSFGRKGQDGRSHGTEIPLLVVRRLTAGLIAPHLSTLAAPPPTPHPRRLRERGRKRIYAHKST